MFEAWYSKTEKKRCAVKTCGVMSNQGWTDGEVFICSCCGFAKKMADRKGKGNESVYQDAN